ncbi:30S ribosomal protein S8e [Candidatus Woesearchaeota archaeon]|nr:30S ribosomal protein S8e [Candidatus Woesearchaeota archaeon]
MAISQHRSKRKISGGRYHGARKKRVFELGGAPAMTVVEKTRKRTVRGKFKTMKQKLLSADTVNLIDKKTGKCTKAKIKTVIDNPANKNFVRRNILTMGTVIDTDKGKARITSRPGQQSTLNAILI